MKAIKTLFFVFVLTLLNVNSTTAGTTPSQSMPPPTAKGAATSSNDPGNGNPGFPIDENIVFLTVAGLALGITVLYKNKIKKASI